jgi:hypothetical protein
MIFCPGCGTVSLAAHHFQAAQPSHSDNPSNASEPISLDTGTFRLPATDDNLMLMP